MPGGSFSLYITRNDGLALLAEVETQLGFRYTLSKHFAALDDITPWPSAASIPDFAVARHGKNTLEARFLVTPADVRVIPREIRRNSGQVVYAVDQMLNAASFTLRPGGVFGAEAVLLGQCGTISTHAWSVEAYSAVRTHAKRRCRTIRGNFVGPEALELARAGARLTMGMDTPPEYDLRID